MGCDSGGAVRIPVTHIEMLPYNVPVKHYGGVRMEFVGKVILGMVALFVGALIALFLAVWFITTYMIHPINKEPLVIERAWEAAGSGGLKIE